MGSQDFFLLSALLCIINGISRMTLPMYVLTFFLLISDGLGGVSRLSWLVAHPSIFRMFMKGKFDPYAPLTKSFQN